MLLLRCYPKITDWVYHITGIDVTFLPIYSYGFFVAAGFLAAAYVITKELKRREALGIFNYTEKDGKKVYPSDLVGDFVIICAIFGILGSSLFNFLESPDSYRDFWQDPFGSLFSGLSVYGGMICSGIALLVYSYFKKINVPSLFDCLAHCFILANGIGRIGCQVSGDGDWGIVNPYTKPDWFPQLLWSDTYAHNIANEGVPIQQCLETHCMELPQAVYTTPLYEFLMCTAIFFILNGLRKQLTLNPGMLLLIFFILIGIQRFTIEQWRDISGRDLYPFLGMLLKQSELISIILGIMGFAGVIALSMYYKKNPYTIPNGA